MKVIGAKSLVQIMPSVVVAKQRVTPGVYEYDSTQPPLISCDGATPSARFSSTGNNINNSGYNLIINDVFYRDFNWDSQGETSYLEHVINTVVPPNTLEIEAWIYDGATWPTDWTIKNISNENLRILIAPWTSACDFEIHSENENPTILSPNEGVFQFCLSPMSNQISCDGATPRAKFTNDGIFDISVNGVLYENPSLLTCRQMVNNFPELAQLINVNGDGDANFINLTQNDLRIMLDPLRTNNVEIHPENNNPTINIDVEGVITFCLSPEPNQISCHGATNQLVISASYSVDPFPDERWKMEITDAVTGVLFTSLTNLSVVEPDHLSVSLTKNKTPECPFEFSLENEIDYNTIIQNVSGSDVRMKLKFVELIDDGEDLTIEFWVRDGSTPVNWITNVEGEDYELTACLSPTPV
ncbi:MULTISPECIES: hypothetical protein [Acinetobacter]|uniref:hypothetical protein n=1 Tax=Acinetobacter TaxID=469 RepID=UPI001F4AA596|nr:MULTISPECIES: hypothetical protein [Acinetobacter]MCH7381608.1 hypothetical protein [Acinetobacter higginsii]